MLTSTSTSISMCVKWKEVKYAVKACSGIQLMQFLPINLKPQTSLHCKSKPTPKRNITSWIIFKTCVIKPSSRINNHHLKEVPSEYIAFLITEKILRKQARRHVYFINIFSLYFSAVYNEKTPNPITACKRHYHFNTRCHIQYHGALWRFRLRAYNLGTVPLTNTRMNTPILLPVTGHCTCQSGAAEATTPGSHFQVGFVWLTGHYLSYVLQKRHRRCTHSQLQVFVISSSSHEKKLINWCLIFSFVQNILSREDTSSTLLVHAILNIKI